MRGIYVKGEWVTELPYFGAQYPERATNVDDMVAIVVEWHLLCGLRRRPNG
jgi:hypothetical protein